MTSYIRYGFRLYEQGSVVADRELPVVNLPIEHSEVADFVWDAEGPPGYKGASLTISLAEYEAHPTVYVSGTTLEVINTADGDRAVWAGKLLKPQVGIGTNRVKLTAHGWGKKASKTIRRFGWQTRDEADWQLGDSDPFDYSVSGLIKGRVNGRSLEWGVRKNTTFKKTSGGFPSEWRTTLVIFPEGKNLRRIAFDWEQDHDDDYTLEVCKATGPTGALTVIDTIALGASSDSYNSGSIANYDSSPFDLLALRVVRSAEEKQSDGWWLKVTNVKVNGSHTAGDTYETYKIVQDIATEVGGDQSNIATTIKNGLPFWPGRVRAPEALDAIAMLDDRAYGIYGDKDPEWHYRDWDHTIWEITDPHAMFVPTSVESISKVWVPYQTAAGVQRWTSASVPGSSGIETEFTIPLEDPLPPKSAADIVAAVFAAYYSNDRAFGAVSAAWIEDTANPGVKVAATRARPGQTMRINGVDYRIGRTEGIEGPLVRFTFPELDYVLQRFLTTRTLLLARGRGSGSATIDALGIGRPALVDTGTMTGTFKRHRKKNRHTQIDLRIDWDAVTLDIRGNPTVVRAHRVQLRPVDGLGVPIPESEGGKILEQVVRDKDTGDSDTIATRIWFRDLERPFIWDWETRIETVDIQGKTSKNGTKSFTDWVNIGSPGSEFDPPAPTGVTLDVDPHNTTARITQPADDEDADDVDDRIHRTTFVLHKNGTEVRRDTVRGGVLSKTWRIKASPGDDFDLFVYNRDSENRRSTTVTDLNNNLADPPDPLSAPTVTIDLGGKKKRRLTVTGTYSGSWTDADVKTAVINALIGGKRYTPEVKLNSDGTFEHVFRGIDKDDTYNITYSVQDTKGNESGSSPAATGTVTDTTPPAPFTVTTEIDGRRFWVKVTMSGDTAEVDRFLYEISNNNFSSVADSKESKSTRVSFPVARASTNWKARVTAIGPSGNQSSTTSQGDAARSATKLDDTSQDLGDITAGTITAATYRTAASGARVAMVDVGGENDRLKVYGSSSLSGSVRSDAGDLLLDAASRVAIAGGLTLRSGSDLLIGDSGALQNRISFRNVGSGTMPTPPTNHCYVWFAGDPSPKELRAKFPNGIVKVLANDS